MKRRALFGFALLPTSALLTGCALKSFEVDPAGAAGAGGSAGEGGINAGGQLSAGFAGVGGVPSGISLPMLSDDEYVVLQGADLSVAAADGLLSNDTPTGLQVKGFSNVDSSRPAPFDAAISVSPDGSFHFIPAPRFFGTYRFSYTAENRVGQSAMAKVSVRVVPTAIDLDAIVQGIGGYVLYGSAGAEIGGIFDAAGDVNGDARNDLVIGAPLANAGDGAAYVVFGKDDLNSIDLEPLAAASSEARYSFLSAGAGAGEALGVSVSGLGDVDGDGLADLVLGANGGSGRAYVVHGAKISGAALLPRDAALVIEGGSSDSNVGSVVRGVGDVNGDALPDILLSSSAATGESSLNILLGAPNLSGRVTLDDAPGLRVHADSAGDGFPLVAANVADLDGDSRNEVLSASNSVFVLLRGAASYPASLSALGIDGSGGGFELARSAPGAAAVAGLSDVDGDGVRDFAFCDGSLTCSVVSGLPSTLAAAASVSGFSRRSSLRLVAGQGDVDGDGIADVLFADEQRAYLVYGSRAGFGELDLGALGSAGFSLRAASGGSISSIAILGDTNHDGLADIAVGDASADAGAGRVYVIFGLPSR